MASRFRIFKRRFGDCKKFEDKCKKVEVEVCKKIEKPDEIKKTICYQNVDLIKTKYRLEGPSGSTDEPDGGYKIWKTLSLFLGLPAIVAAALNAYWGHLEHHEREPFVKYEFLRLRSKRFAWGDGNHSFFHNRHTNPLPDGYEDDDD